MKRTAIVAVAIVAALMLLDWHWGGDVAVTEPVTVTVPAPPADLLAEYLAEPEMPDTFVYAARPLMGGIPHGYETFGWQVPEAAVSANPPRHNVIGLLRGAQLRVRNLRTGEDRVILEDPDGSIRDPYVHYDGAHILFSWRPGADEFHHLYEIKADGTGLRQLTRGDYDDVEPCYLPDGGIAFVSSRARRWVPCFVTQVGLIYRCDADGGNMRLLTPNMDHDLRPWVMADGRLLFTRWEYIDRHEGGEWDLWAMRPDGSGAARLYSSGLTGAKPVPGTNLLVAISGDKGSTNYRGGLVLLDLGHDSDSGELKRGGKESLVGKARDPLAVTQHWLLYAGQDGIQLLHRPSPGEAPQEMLVIPNPDTAALKAKARIGGRGTGLPLACHEPMALAPRPRETVLPPVTNWEKTTGRLMLADVYRGQPRSLNGITPGDIAAIAVYEQLPVPVKFRDNTAGQCTLSSGWTLKRYLGTFPVEGDGSAYVELPARRAVQFIALDKDGMGIKRMHAGISVMPGETLSCVGCHENRAEATANYQPRQALTRPVSALAVEPGVPEDGIVDYTRVVQPIWDKHCVRCHNADIHYEVDSPEGDALPRLLKVSQVQRDSLQTKLPCETYLYTSDSVEGRPLLETVQQPSPSGTGAVDAATHVYTDDCISEVVNANGYRTKYTRHGGTTKVERLTTPSDTAALSEITYSYDTTWRLTGTTDSGGKSTNVTYSTVAGCDHLPGTVTGIDGHSVSMQYDARGNLIQSTDPLGITAVTEFSGEQEYPLFPTGLVKRISETRQSTPKERARFTYDASSGLPLTQTTPGPATASERPWRTTQDVVASANGTFVSGSTSASVMLTTPGQDLIAAARASQAPLWIGVVATGGNSRALDLGSCTLTIGAGDDTHTAIAQGAIEVTAGSRDNATTPVLSGDCRLLLRFDSLGTTDALDASLGLTASDSSGDLTFHAVALALDPDAYPADQTAQLFSDLGTTNTTCAASTECTAVYRYDGAGNTVFASSVSDDPMRHQAAWVDYGPAPIPGQPLSVTDSFGKVSSVTYFSNGQIKSATDALSRTTHYEYDPVGRLQHETGPDGKTTAHLYYEDEPAVEVVFPPSANGMSASSVKSVLAYWGGPALKVEHYGEVAGATDGTLVNVETYTYGPAGELLESDDKPAGVTGDTCWKSVATYDALYRLKSTAIGSRNPTTYDYTPKTASAGATVTVTTPSGVTATKQYDSLDRLSTITTRGETITYTYDSYGRPHRVTLPGGAYHQITYDAWGRQESVTSVDDSETETQTVTAWDDTDLPTAATQNITGQSAKAYTWRYTAAGASAVATEGGITRKAWYDARGLTTLTLGPNGEKRGYAYDAAGRQTELIEYGKLNGSNTEQAWPTKFVYWPNTDLVSETRFPLYDPALYMDRDRLEYDGLERTSVIEDGAGVRRTLKYTSFDALKEVTYDDGSEHVVCEYDEYRRPISITDNAGSRTCIYNADGDIESATTAYTGMPARTIGYTYNTSDGSRATMTLPLATGPGTFIYGYEDENDSPMGQLMSLEDPFGGTTRWTRRWDDVVTKQVMPNDIATVITRTTLKKRLTGLTNRRESQPATVLSQFTAIEYDWKGRLTSFQRSVPSITPAQNKNVWFTYWENGRICQDSAYYHELPGGESDPRYWYHYDERGNLETSPGRMLGRQDNHPTNAYERAHDEDNQWVGIYDRIQFQLVEGANAFRYDIKGNPTRYKGRELRYDSDNRLTEYWGAGVTALPTGQGQPQHPIFRAGYRSDSLRAWKEVRGDNGNGDPTKTYFLYDGETLVAEMNADGTVTAVITDGPNGIVSRHTWDGTAYTPVYYTYDVLGNVVQRLDANAAPLSTYEFDAYGNLLQHLNAQGQAVVCTQDGAITAKAVGDVLATDVPVLAQGDPYGYKAQYGYYTDQIDPRDPAHAVLIYCWHRYYDPYGGRWLTRDPLGHDGGVNLYEYCGGEPVGLVDPTGRSAVGHHLIPQCLWDPSKLSVVGGFSQEAKSVFGAAVTGQLHPNHGFLSPHGEYIAAVREELLQFLSGPPEITPETMTKEQALQFVERIRKSERPVIKRFLTAVRTAREAFVVSKALESAVKTGDREAEKACRSAMESLASRYKEEWRLAEEAGTFAKQERERVLKEAFEEGQRMLEKATREATETGAKKGAAKAFKLAGKKVLKKVPGVGIIVTAIFFVSEVKAEGSVGWAAVETANPFPYPARGVIRSFLRITAPPFIKDWLARHTGFPWWQDDE